MQTKNAIGNLKNRYLAVLKKCNLLNVFGSLAVVGMLVTGTVGVAYADNVSVSVPQSGSVDAGVVAGVKPGGNLNIEGGVAGVDVSTSGPIVVQGGLNVIGGSSGDTKFTVTDDASFRSNVSAQGSQNGKATISLKENTSFTAPLVNIGLNAELNVEGATVNSNVVLNDKSSTANLTGNSTIAGELKAEAGTVNVSNSTSNVKVNTLAAGNGAVVNVSNGATLSTDNINVSSGSTVNVNSSAKVSTANLNASKDAVIYVGNETSKGEFSVAGMTSLVGGTIFLDPAWVGNDVITNASRAALANFANNTIDGNLIVGSNSFLVIGSTNTAVAEQVFVNSGLIWGKNNVSAAMFLDRPHYLANNGFIFVDGSATNFVGGNITTGSGVINTAAMGGSATFADKSLLVVNAGNVPLGHAALTGSGVNSKLSVAGTSKLHIVGGKDGQVLNVAANFADTSTTIAGASWNGINLSQDNHLLNAIVTQDFTNNVAGSNFVVTLTANKTTSIYSYLNHSLADLVDVVVFHGLDNNSLNSGIKFVSRATSNEFIDINNPKFVASTIEGAAKLSVATGVMNTTANASDMAVGSIGDRLSMIGTSANSTFSANSGSVILGEDGLQYSGVNSGGSMSNGVGLWVQPMYQDLSASSFDSGAFEYGYSANVYGASVGADYTINNLRFGAAVHAGGGSSDSDGDFAKAENDFDYYGFGLYAGYIRNNLGLSADVGYTTVNNDVDQDNRFLYGIGGRLSTGGFDSSTLTVGLNAEYKFETSALDIIPYLGVRLNYVDVDEYNTRYDGGVAFRNEGSNATTFAIPVGVVLAKEIETSGGVKVTPNLDLGVQFTMGDLDVDQNVHIPGIYGVSSMESEIFDPVTFKGGLGVGVSKDRLNFALDYNINASSNMINQGVMATLRFDF